MCMMMNEVPQVKQDSGGSTIMFRPYPRPQVVVDQSHLEPILVPRPSLSLSLSLHER